MKKRAYSVVVLALLLASILVGLQSNSAHACEYYLGQPQPITQ